MDFIVALKQKNELNLVNRRVKDKIEQDADISSSKFLQKSASIPLPESKLRPKIEFTKAYLERATLDESNEPNILNISVVDPNENITCIEIEKAGDLVLTGYLDGKIILVLLNPNFEPFFDLEKSKKNFWIN